MNEERVFFNEGGNIVSVSRVIIDGTTYATANITSVKQMVRQPSTGCPLALIIVGVLTGLGALVAFSSSALEGLMGLVVTAAILAIGFAWMRGLKPTHVVVLVSSAGETDALASRDKALVARVVAAINDAIVARG